MSEKSSQLELISSSIDKILDKPIEEWTTAELKMYQLLKAKVNQYQANHATVQFSFDLRDIKNNVTSSNWYQSSIYHKTVNWLLNQLEIKSYQHSRHRPDYKLECFFNKSQVKLIILKKPKTRTTNKYLYHLENLPKEEKFQTQTLNQESFPRIAKVFGIKTELDQLHQMGVIRDITHLIKEIALFYS